MGEKGMVYLVGAGPGDAGLITVKGLECIQQAQVIVYDRLVNPQLLNSAPEEAELIYAGKGPGLKGLSQDEINSLLVEKAAEGKVVVRLKGGDPFVFGRGGEEAGVLAEHGIPFEAVPGVTSAVAVPAYSGIPVTDRRYASSVAIFAGSEASNRKETRTYEWQATGSADTLVFLMGMGNLAEIVKRLQADGKDINTPVAVIQGGTRAEQRTIVGNLNDIVEKVRKAGFGPPAVIVVGEVAKLRELLKWREKKPLFGLRILVTRSREQSSELSRLITQHGGEPLEFPTIRISDPEDLQPMDDAIARIESYDWILFTSVNGVRCFMRRLLVSGKDVRMLGSVRIGAIGPSTAEGLAAFGLRPDLVPKTYRAESLALELKDDQVRGRRFLLPRAAGAREVLPQALRSRGAIVDEVAAYRTTIEKESTLRKGLLPVISMMLSRREIHVITFTSSSTVRNFIASIGGQDAKRLLDGITIACIGPITAEAVQDFGLEPEIVAAEHTIPGLVEALVKWAEERRKSRGVPNG
ncbi:MAG: uroporphyrinogen-III C-methyltransferase [Firmicutes bacterium]|nr:uroporphyrinogen-III C-methyltransferase [Bacillota bacterium]